MHWDALSHPQDVQEGGRDHVAEAMRINGEQLGSGRVQLILETKTLQ